MASKILHTAQRRAATRSIDAPLAVLAGVAVGFVLFAMPVDIFSRAIEMSRLPDFVPAAQPPLGTKARAAFALIGAGTAFTAVFLLLRALGRRPEPRARREPADPEVPRVRRSDVHPDAPPRRPILAGRDFGEPDPRTNSFSQWPADDAPATPEPEQEPAAEGELVLTEIFEAPESTAPQRRPLPDLEPLLPASAYREPEPVRAPEPIPQPGPAFRSAEDSIADLMARLEWGVARRQRRQAVAPQQQTPDPIFAGQGDERLRTAIEKLQRMAQRAG